MIKKRDFIWNMMGSLIYAFFNAIILLFCTRINGVDIAGIFSICFATSVVLNAIGDFGFRVYQVTDTNRKYTFKEYLTARFCAVICMFIIGIIFILISQYTFEKALICISLILYRVIDNISETYQGEFQLNSRLDIAGKSVVMRNCFSIMLFFIVDYITKNIVVACSVLVVGNFLIFWIYDKRKLKNFNKSEEKAVSKKSILTIIIECLPVALSSVMCMYLTNAVKYAIDLNGNNEMQTIFNIIYLPTFTINLVGLLLIKMILKQLGEAWNSNEIKKFAMLNIKVVGIIILASIIIEMVCATIGIPILTFLYGIDLSNYVIELLILVFSGCIYAISNLLLNSITTLRKQKKATIAYTIVSVLSFFICNYFVKNYQLRGASISNVIITGLLVLFLTVIYIKEIWKKRKNTEI